MRVCCLAGKWESYPASSRVNGSFTANFLVSITKPYGSRNRRCFPLPASLEALSHPCWESTSLLLGGEMEREALGGCYQYSCTAATHRPHFLLNTPLTSAGLGLLNSDPLSGPQARLDLVVLPWGTSCFWRPQTLLQWEGCLHHLSCGLWDE